MNGRKSLRHKTRDTGLTALIIGFTLALSGCTSQQRTNAAEEVGPRQVCLGSIDKARAMRAAQHALIDMHFTIDKADETTGLIRTHPLSGAQFFEFWRKDSVGSFNKKEANLHSIQRIATLQLGKGNEGICIECEVATQRLNLPEHEVSNSSRAYALFTKSSASLQRMRLNPEQQAEVAWVDIGKDGRLAVHILERIEARISDTGGTN